MSNLLGYTYDNLSSFQTLYVLVALLNLIPYFDNKKKYFLILIFFGLIIDIAYANTFILNTCLFVVCYYISKSFHAFFPYNWLTLSISNTLCVFSYHIISFIFLNILRYDTYGFNFLIKILSHSIFMTVVYSNIIYICLLWIQKKIQVKTIKI